MTAAIRTPLRRTLAGVVAYADLLRSEARGRRTPAGRIAVMLNGMTEHPRTRTPRVAPSPATLATLAGQSRESQY
jgi:hypothetical protein